MSNYKTTTIKGEKGLNLVLRSWTVDVARADILFCHGFQEYSGRYHSEAEFFNSAGYNFYAFDMRTHGESEGKERCYIEEFDDYINDLDSVKKHYKIGKERPFFLMGHSMGGLVVVSYVLAHRKHKNFTGMLLSAPLLQTNSDMAPTLQKMAGIVGKITPRLKTVKLDINAVSSDPEEVKKYKEDPLIYKKGIYAKSGMELINQTRNIQQQFQNIKCDFIIQHSLDDQLSDYKGSQRMVENCSSESKMLVALDNLGHEILKDKTKESVRNTFLDWMDFRINP